MKNIFRSLAIIALVTAIGFSFTACSSKNSGGKSLNSTDDLKAYLDKQPANSPSKPIRISMKANEIMIGNIKKVLDEAGKYVNLNLTGSPLTTVPDEVFNECKSLVGITIPNSVTSIGKRAFLKCTSLASVTFEGTISYANFKAGTDLTRTFPGNLHARFLRQIKTTERLGRIPLHTLVGMQYGRESK
jgi:hypothetical protein